MVFRGVPGVNNVIIGVVRALWENAPIIKVFHQVMVLRADALFFLNPLSYVLVILAFVIAVGPSKPLRSLRTHFMSQLKGLFSLLHACPLDEHIVQSSITVMLCLVWQFGVVGVLVLVYLDDVFVLRYGRSLVTRQVASGCPYACCGCYC